MYECKRLDCLDTLWDGDIFSSVVEAGMERVRDLVDKKLTLIDTIGLNLKGLVTLCYLERFTIFE